MCPLRKQVGEAPDPSASLVPVQEGRALGQLLEHRIYQPLQPALPIGRSRAKSRLCRRALHHGPAGS